MPDNGKGEHSGIDCVAETSNKRQLCSPEESTSTDSGGMMAKKEKKGNRFLQPASTWHPSGKRNQSRMDEGRLGGQGLFGSWGRRFWSGDRGTRSLGEKNMLFHLRKRKKW